jgi:uncharacterized protein YgiM (DUF1202 family)
MKTIFTYVLPVMISLLISSFGNAQSSKSCGSCHKPVSVYSEVGDYCPHCHVRWGYENTTTNYVDNYSSDTYQSYSGIGFVTSNSNLRSYASKSASVIMVVPQYASVTIIGKYGSWYYVRYGNGYSYNSSAGYIHSSLIDVF